MCRKSFIMCKGERHVLKVQIDKPMSEPSAERQTLVIFPPSVEEMIKGV